ncbi:MAG: flagellar hook-basal body complex protein FliE [Oscillospiraceae bacterium]|nr:flagellar hook-basal body complex protein FliE [Oscillospiraceae bacterium]
MFIVPISGAISPVQSVFDNENEQVKEVTESSPQFSDVFKEVFNDVQETQQQTNIDAVKLMQGEIDDLHTIYNNMTKASIAVETFVAVKNAAVDAYNQVLQISM